MNYEVAFSLEKKRKMKEVSNFIVKLFKVLVSLV